ncbi:helix-turn-helix domain-containing protein [Rhizobium sp. CSW-27]|uniref:helix-turn-helix domain-containing protein n=1 Tax=Rhizobium sp. CSW-27 TaxID=2839985 RepID=UPI001C01AC0A|nr:helix-turn-helix domain-containing protein [Rhizobium sp. CSW-27]MBT9373196.1 helix-turn-helix domain-containing protein [Rhizobium sp. CSW-27]
MAASDLKPGTRLVLQTLGTKMNADGGGCWPTIDELVGLTGFSKKTVLVHLGKGVAAGWLSISKGEFYGQMHRRNSYFARFPAVDETAADAENEAAGEGDPEGGKVVEFLPEGGGISTPEVVEKLHHDKESPKNSPDNSPKESASARATSGAERRQAEKAFVRWLRTWPNAERYSLNRAKSAFLRLDIQQRAACLRLTPEYLRAVPVRGRIANPADYLTERAWEKLPVAPVIAPSERVAAKPFGKLWMAYRLWLLLQPPEGPLHLTAFDQRRLDQGLIEREVLLCQKRAASGWPTVNAMLAAARSREPFFCPPALKGVADGFRQVQRGSDLFHAWERLHLGRCWPWFQWTTEYPWFPAVDLTTGDLDAAVDAAMTDFARQVSEGLNNAG